MKERLWQITFMLLLMAGFMLGGLVAQDNTPAKVIRAQRFELVDASGQTMLTMTRNLGNEASIKFLDKEGRTTLELSSDPIAGANLVSYHRGKDGKGELWMHNMGDGQSFIEMRDRAGKTRLLMGCGEETGPSITLYALDGTSRRITP
jgi:hypothetical protein